MASMYSAKVMEHFANPHNVGELPDANGVGEVGNPKCGDIMRMYLKIENNVIQDVRFLTFGCGAAIATSSMATDLIKGKTIDEALKLTNKAVVEALDGLPPVKVHCSVLAEQAVKAALSDYYRRQGIAPDPIVGKLEEDCDHCDGSSCARCAARNRIRKKHRWKLQRCFLFMIGKPQSVQHLVYQIQFQLTWGAGLPGGSKRHGRTHSLSPQAAHSPQSAHAHGDQR